MGEHNPYYGVTFSMQGWCPSVYHWDYVAYGNPHSGSKFLYNGCGEDRESMAFAAPVHFAGAWVGKPHSDEKTFWFEGYRNGALVGATTPVALTGTMQFVGANFGGQVDKVVIRRTGGWWVMDDVCFGTEPLSAADCGATPSAPVDVTAPEITASIAGTPGADGWYTSDVTVSWTVSDAESTVTSPACSNDVVTADTDGVTITCTATSAGGTTTESVTIKRDAGDPTITGSASSSGWTNQNVAVTFTCSDATSGVASCGPNKTLSDEGANQSASGTAVDNAGNTASATVGNIDIDKTKPVVVFGGNAGSYTLDEVVAITCSATDALSGIESSSCPTASGPAYTFNLGVNTLSASATDRADNTSTASTSFTVSVTSGSLCAVTRSLVSQAGIASSLCAKLDAAAAAAVRGNSSAKAGQIGAYANQVQAQSGKSITAANAQLLIDLAQAL